MDLQPMDPRVPLRRNERKLLLQVLHLGLEAGAGLLKRSVARKQRRNRRVRIAFACDAQPTGQSRPLVGVVGAMLVHCRLAPLPPKILACLQPGDTRAMPGLIAALECRVAKVSSVQEGERITGKVVEELKSLLERVYCSEQQRPSLLGR